MENKPSNKLSPTSNALQPSVTAGELRVSDCLTGPSCLALVREHGRGAVTAAVAKELTVVNELCGGGQSSDAIFYMAELILERWGGRTMSAVRLMLRDGMNSGKIYGKLTYPLLAEWMNDHEAKVEEYSYRKHMGSK